VHRNISEAVRAEGVPTLWSHVSHVYPQGASIYFIVFLAEDGAEAALTRYRGVWNAAMQETLEAGGSISHHHGVGRMRLPWIAREQGSAIEVLTRIKGALDPYNILTPGALGLSE
jgi:alkyldihydroxyacetonephosphate synthase